MNDWLADVLRAEGLRVVELDGWQRRQTRPGFDPVGLVCHHTATPKSASNDSVRRLLSDGRSDLPGPLSQLGLERDGTVVVVAGGRCNHNGYGLWGNDAFGIEAYNDGVGEPWPSVQLVAYRKAVAAICRRMGWKSDRVKAHRETDPGRKPDPVGIDMAAFRLDVAKLLNPSPPSQEDDDMAASPDKFLCDSDGHTWLVNLDAGRVSRVAGPNDVRALAKLYEHIGVVSRATLDGFKG